MCISSSVCYRPFFKIFLSVCFRCLFVCLIQFFLPNILFFSLMSIIQALAAAGVCYRPPICLPQPTHRGILSPLNLEQSKYLTSNTNHNMKYNMKISHRGILSPLNLRRNLGSVYHEVYIKCFLSLIECNNMEICHNLYTGNIINSQPQTKLDNRSHDRSTFGRLCTQINPPTPSHISISVLSFYLISQHLNRNSYL